MTHQRWADVPREQMNESIVRQYVTGDRVTVARLEMARGGVVGQHAHENEQVSLVLSGSLRFTIEGRDTVVRAGEMMTIPGGVPHAVEVLEDCITIDVFSPIRRDWIEKTDTYFKR